MAGMMLMVSTRGGGGGVCGGVGGSGVENGKSSSGGGGEEKNSHQQQQVSVVDVLLAALRKSMVSCRVERHDEMVMSTVDQRHTGGSGMEIGWPTNVKHITHVTFDRFQGFLGLPLEFQVEIPCRVPSASVSVFGVSAETMQCCYDKRGNSVPTILLLMQERLYSHGGLKAEGIFRINAENSQEEHVRDQLNRGVVPDDIEVHCLAGLIKAWFRELPSGVLDGLSPEQVLQCSREEEFVELVEQLKPTESALLRWAIDLMADVVEHEETNKMNARNIAMVFAPNMTQMSDPLTALMHAVQVMNLLKALIVKTLREREEEEEEEEEEAGEYSSTSSSPHSSSSGRPTDEEIDGSQEEEEMDTSCCESAGEERDEVESLSEIEDSFLRQLDQNESAKNGFRKELEGILGGGGGGKDVAGPGSDSSATDSESKTGSSSGSSGNDGRGGEEGSSESESFVHENTR